MLWDLLPHAARNGIRTPVLLAHTSPRIGLGKPDPHCPWRDTRILQKLSKSWSVPDPSAACTHVSQDRSREAGPTLPVEGHSYTAKTELIMVRP